MSLGEEPDKPITGDEHLVPRESADLAKPETDFKPPEPSRPLTVVISGDGSATIEGVPVPVVGDESTDAAILDTLQGYALSRNSPVTAAISDPSSGYVAVVEVAPDGSSRLLEQHQEESSKEQDLAGSSAPAGFPGVAEPAVSRDFDVELPPQPAQTQFTTSAPSPSLDKESRPGRKERQSDDEYAPPGLLQRPLFLGVAGIALAAIVVVPLILVGSSAGDEQNQATGAAQGQDKSPSVLSPTPTYSPSASASPSPLTPYPPSPSVSSSSSVAASASAAASPSPKPKPKTKPKPTVTSAKGSSGIPEGSVLIKNKKYGFCVDLPGTGKAKPSAGRDSSCNPSSNDNQEWVLDLAARGGGTRGADLYLVRNVKSGLCLDVPNYGPAPVTAAVGVFYCNASAQKDNQLWWFDKRPNGTYWVRNQRSGDMCLDVSRTNKMAAHADLTLFGCNDLDDHEWMFREG